MLVETNVITNEVFLRAIFGAEWPEAHVTSFVEDPAKARRGWAGWLASRGLSALPAGANNYFVVSTFTPRADGRPARRKELFRATYVIVLDDVAEKLPPGPMRAALGEPSYRLETSPGSEQWGYILAEPETNMPRVDALVAGLIRSGLNPSGKDPGMKGVTRYVRLPVGRNTKAKCGPDGFQCVLHEWHPERRFTLDALAAALGVDLESTPAPRALPVRHAGEHERMLEALEVLGLVKGQAAEGWLDITCPFVHEHTGGADNGTAYSLTGGGFKCNHGHCDTRRTPEFQAEIVARLWAEGHGHWFARQEFLSADKRALAALRSLVRDKRPVPPRLARTLACVPMPEIRRDLEGHAIFYDTDPQPILAAIRRARRAWTRIATRRGRAPDTVPLPADYRTPVTLAEQQNEMAGALAVFASGAAPVGRVPLVRRSAHGAARTRFGAQ